MTNPIEKKRITFEDLGTTPEEVWPEIHYYENHELEDEALFHPTKQQPENNQKPEDEVM